MSLIKTSARGAIWLGLLRAGIKLFSFIKLAIVARILSPQDFGYFAMITIPYGLLEVATETGINQALIQSPQDIKKDLSSAWLVFILRGGLISLLLILLANLISRIFQSPLTPAIRLIAIAPLLKGFTNPAVVLFRKQLQFSREFIFQFLASVTESIATIILAIKLHSMLALPLGVVSGALVAVILSFGLSRLHLAPVSWQKIKQLYLYGRWVTLGTLASYLNDQGDDFLVGKVLGANSLGLYQTAYKISNLPTTQGASLVYQVVFPIFSTIQDQFNRLRRGVIKSLLATFILSLSFGLSIYLLAPVFTQYILGEKWLPMLPALNILIIFGILRPLISVGGAFFDAIGKPQISSLQAVIKLAVLLILVYPLTIKLGIIGTAWTVVIAQASVFPWFFYQLSKALKP